MLNNIQEKTEQMPKVIWRKAASSTSHSLRRPIDLSDHDSRLTQGSLDQRKPGPQMTSRSVQPFLRDSRTWPTDRQTDKPRYSVCSNRPHLMHRVHAKMMRCDLKCFCVTVWINVTEWCYTETHTLYINTFIWQQKARRPLTCCYTKIKE